MASVEKHGSGYRVVISNGFKTNANGKKTRDRILIDVDESVYAGLQGKKLEKTLKEHAVIVENDFKKGISFDGKKMNFGDFIKQWDETFASKHMRPASLKSYRSHIKWRIIPKLGHLKVAEIKAPHIIQYNNENAEPGARLDGKSIPTPYLLEIINQQKYRKLHQEIGITLSTYLRIKAGGNTLPEIADRFAAYFDCPVQKLFTPQMKKLSPRTVRHLFDTVFTLLQYAVAWDIIEINPASKVGKPKYKRKEIGFYEEDELAIFFKALDNEPLKYQGLAMLGLDFGPRSGELTGLKWKMVDLDNATVDINFQRIYLDSNFGIQEGPPKTDKGERFIHITPLSVLLLKRLLHSQKENRLRYGNLYHISDFVFVHEDGRPIHPQLPNKWLRRFQDKYGLSKHVTFHGLRHTSATLQIAGGTDIETVSERLGHSYTGFTYAIYVHAMKSKKKQAADTMNNMIENIKASSSKG